MKRIIPPMMYNEERSYVFYGTNAEKFIKYEAETRYKIMTNIGKKTVQLMRTNSVDSFVDKWSQMGMMGDKIAYRIEEVHIIYHGRPRGIAIEGSGSLLADARVSKDNSIYTLGQDVTINQLDSKNILFKSFKLQ